MADIRRFEKELALLNGSTRRQRLSALNEIVAHYKNQELFPPFSDEVNNHVHTIYSFSPYSPTATAFMARMAGLKAVGIMDHDSVSGSLEMELAGNILGIATTNGCEIRVNMNGTSVEGLRTNNPDSENISYIAFHGVPHQKREILTAFLSDIKEARNERNREETKKLNSLIRMSGLPLLDFDKDVLSITQFSDGGGVTERHILFAFAGKIVNHCGKGDNLVAFLKDSLKLEVSSSVENLLSDKDNVHYQYDLLGLLKSSFVDKIFIQPDERECPSVVTAVAFANTIGAIPCYAYLGDVESSATGDKKTQKFEDDFLDKLVIELVTIGFKAITYMPPRNSTAQLERVSKLCKANGLIEISGVDINSSRQQFNCPEVMLPQYSHLIESTWALMEHERASSKSIELGFFGKESQEIELSKRLEIFSKRGKKLFLELQNQFKRR